MCDAHFILSLFALSVGICHLVVILVYFFGLVHAGTAKYVSSLLSNDAMYMNLMTFFVLLQLTTCFGFVRLHTYWSTGLRIVTESLFLAISWIGWCILIICYKVEGSVSRLHYLGVGLFVTGGVIYFAFLIWELYRVNQNAYASWVLMLLYFASVFLGALFIIGFFLDWKSSWIFEHLAFTAFSLAHIFLFSVDMCAEHISMFKGVRIERT
jgi:hypothetical protein